MGWSCHFIKIFSAQSTTLAPGTTFHVQRTVSIRIVSKVRHRHLRIHATDQLDGKRLTYTHVHNLHTFPYSILHDHLPKQPHTNRYYCTDLQSVQYDLNWIIAIQWTININILLMLRHRVPPRLMMFLSMHGVVFPTNRQHGSTWKPPYA